MAKNKAEYDTTYPWFDSTRELLRPPPDLMISQWAEQYRVLSSPSEERGPLRLSRTPYMIPIMDACLDPSIETVIFKKPAQIAGTEFLINVIGYYSHREPCSIMLVMADESTAQWMMKERIHKMYGNSPGLKHLLGYQSLKENEITLLNESHISIGWATSVAKLASRPIRILLLDEIDKPGYYQKTREASSISLAIERTETFYNRKIIMISTPTIVSGNISEYFNNVNIKYDYHVPCPDCGLYQPLRWSKKYSIEFPDGKFRDHEGNYRSLGHIYWEGGRDATTAEVNNAGYKCGECGYVMTTAEKNNAVEHGKMVSRDEAKDEITSVGFHINRIYSLLGKSGNIPKLVKDWLKIINDNNSNPELLQGFVNSTLAASFKHVIKTSTESEILRAKCNLPPQTVPQDAVVLTVGIDVQKNSFWFAMRAWHRNYTSWLIHYGQLFTWSEVETLLFETQYPVEGTNRYLRPWRAAIDTGGTGKYADMSMTEETELWVRANQGQSCGVWGIKGAATVLPGLLKIGKNRDSTPSGKPLPGGINIISLNTDKLKDNFHFRLGLAKENQPQAAYLHSETGMDYAKHILAEEKQIVNGMETWVKVKTRNDLLDCEIYASATASSEWPGGGVNLIGARVGGQAKGRRIISQGI